MSVASLAANSLALRAVCSTSAYRFIRKSQVSLPSRALFCLTPYCSLHERTARITAARRVKQSVQASAGQISMSSTYAHELQAACAAVKLAARLCTVLQSNCLLFHQIYLAAF